MLNNCQEVEKYLKEHRNIILARRVRNVEHEQEIEFPMWFKDKVNEMRAVGSYETTDELMSSSSASDSGTREDGSGKDGGGRQTIWRLQSCIKVLEKALRKQKHDKLEVEFEKHTGDSVGEIRKWFNNLIPQIV
ncbi:uncharacterized protein [Henckelia pumila]|uniref:uncharacterized protein n=1 Tax=Henckelia pumila TaxID=405737 RepID=UPI003C6DC485